MEYRALDGFRDIEPNELGHIRYVDGRGDVEVYHVSSGDRYQVRIKRGEHDVGYKIRTSIECFTRKTILAPKRVATLFVPNPNNYQYVRAIDGNKANYAASNLEWVKSLKSKQTEEEKREKRRAYDKKRRQAKRRQSCDSSSSSSSTSWDEDDLDSGEVIITPRSMAEAHKWAMMRREQGINYVLSHRLDWR